MKIKIANSKTKGFKRVGLSLLYCAAAGAASSVFAPVIAAPATFAPPLSLSGQNGSIETWGVSSVDLNNDYCADLFFGNHRLEPSVYLGNCDGTFESRPDLVVGDNIHIDAHTTVFGDFKNTGCSDAHISTGGTLSTSVNHFNHLLRGNVNASGECTGLLTRDVGSDTEYPEQRARSSVPLDVDYDGDLDLVTTGYAFDSNSAGGSEAIFLNDGLGELEDAPAVLANQFGGHRLTIFNILADLDGDNELDLICGESTFPGETCSKDVRASFANGKLLSEDLSLKIVRSAGGRDNVTSGIVDAFAEDIDGDGDNDLVALRRVNQSGNAARIESNRVVEGLNTTGAQSPMRCVGIPGAVDIESVVVTGDYINSRDIKFGRNATTRNLPDMPLSSVRRYEYSNVTRADNLGLRLPEITDGVNENERGTYIGYSAAEQMWRLCDVTGFVPSGTVVDPSPRRNFNKYGFRIEFSGPVGELVHEGYNPSTEPLRPVVWVNNGNSGKTTEFENTSANGGIDKAITAFALGKGDFDNDGDMDFIATYENHGVRNNHYLFSNDGLGSFDRSRINGCPTGVAESIAIADLNDDGRLDPIIACAWFGVAHKTNHAHSIWLNNTDNNNKAIMFSMVGNSSNREGIGAKITVTDANDRTKTVCTRDVGNTFSRGSQDSEFVHCGVALRTTVDVIVDWPGNLGQSIYNNVSTGALYSLEEGSNSPELIKPFVPSSSPAPIPTVLPVIEVNYSRVDEVAGSARLLVRLDDGQTNTGNSDIEVDYVTVDNSAVAGQDYGRVSGTAIIAPGRKWFVVEIPIFTDSVAESIERFNVELSNPVGATINPIGGVVQINNVN